MSYLTLHKYVELCNKNKLDNKDILPFSNNIMYMIDHIAKSIMYAREGISKINPGTEDGKYILDYRGFTGTTTRHFYNNICNSDSLGDITYLEIGTWYGSSSISAVYKNDINGLFIDNWSQFNGDSNIFKENINKFIQDKSNLLFLESDCWKVNLENLNIGPFNVYLYDGAHTELDHFKSLDYYYPVLKDVFIFMVDDWNWSEVRDGTMRAINKLGLHILFRHEEFISEDDLKNMPYHRGKQTWWNGIAIFLLSKSPIN